MSELSCIDLNGSKIDGSPFPHFSCTSVLSEEVQQNIYEWLETTNQWDLTVADFYTQFEFVLNKTNLTEDLQCLISEKTVTEIQNALRNAFKITALETVSVVAHKHVTGHKIGIHNDYIDGEETHRLVIQINQGWSAEKGGYLMLFGSGEANDVSKIIEPIHNSAFGFEISNKSFHAVSTIYNFSRYSIVYTFKERDA